MKKLLFILLLFIIPAFCLGQTVSTFTPSFKRKVPVDSLLGWSVPGVTGTKWVPDTAWIARYSVAYFNHQHSGTGTISDPVGIKDDTLTAFNFVVLKNDSGNFTHSPYFYWDKAGATFQFTGPVNFASTVTGLPTVYNIFNHTDSLTDDRAVSFRTHSLQFGDLVGNKAYMFINPPSSTINAQIYDPALGVFGFFGMNNNAISFQIGDTLSTVTSVTLQPRTFNIEVDTLNTPAYILSFNVATREAIFSDDQNHRGLNYRHINFTNFQDSTLVPKKYVVDYVAAHAGTGTVTSVSGTTNRITSTGGSTPVIDISATFEALLEKVANKTATASTSTTTYPNWLGVENYVSTNVAKRTHMIDFMGDSMTSNGTFPNYLISLLVTGWTGANFGISGDNTTGMLARFNSVTIGSPEYVVILAGVNDLTGGVYSLATTEANLQAMYTAAHNTGAKVIALTVLPFGTNVSWTSGIQTNLTALNTWISSTATNVDYVINTYTIMGQGGSPQNLNPTYDSGDGKHPNTAGYQLIATSINSAVTFTQSSSATTISLAKNITIDQDLQTQSSVFFKTVNTTNLVVTNDMAGSIPAPVVLGSLIPFMPNTQGAHAYDATLNALAWNNGTSWQYNTLQNVATLGSSYTGTVTLGGVIVGTGSSGYTGGVVNNANLTGSSAYGYTQSGVIQSGVTSASLFSSNANIGSGATLTNLFHFRANAGTFTGTTAAQYGFYVPSGMTGATINKAFDGELASAASTYNLYMGGTATNYLNGNLLLNYATASKPLFTDGSKNVTTTGPSTSSNFIMGDGSFTTTIPNGTIATTQTAGDNSTKVATTAYVNTAVNAAATSVSNADGTLTISPTTGAVVASLALGHANTWTAAQIIQNTTGPQFSVNYDGTNKATFSTSSVGNLTITPSGGTTINSGAMNVTSYALFGTTTTNLFNPNAFTGASSATVAFQYAGSSTNYFRVVVGGGTTTSPVTGTNYSGFMVATASVTTPASGSIPYVSAMVVKPPTIINGGVTPTNAQSGMSYPAAGATNNFNWWFNGGITRTSSIQVDTLTASKVIFTDANKRMTSTGIGTSSQGIDGSGGLYSLNSKPHTIFTPTTGGTVNLTNNQYNIINPAGALLALTINLPSSPANNDCVFIKYTQNVTTVTYANGTVVDGITAPTAGGLVVLTYDSGTTSWY